MERWQITRTMSSANRLYDRTFVVMTVRDDDGSFRPLDRRTLDALAEADTWRRGMHALHRIEEANRRQEEAVDRDWRNHIDAVAGDRHPAIQREIDEQIGAVNVPRQDLQMALDEEPVRQGRWLGPRRRHPRTGRRLPRQVEMGS
jgi:hypothetical protein